MSCCFGLYFGSSNLCLAMQKDGQTEVLANAAGDRVTPAIVAFLNGEKSVGLAAKQGMYRNAGNTVTHVKKLVGGDSKSHEEEISRSPCNIVDEGGLKYQIEKEGRITHYAPIEILITLFTTMREIAQSHSHEEETYPTVVTVPVGFDAKQREVVRKAIVQSGFELLQIINEPTAALLAYNVGQQSTNGNSSIANGQQCTTSFCVVYRMGGTSLEVTVFRVVDGMYSVASLVSKDVGGCHFTDCVVDFCAGEFQRQYKVDVKESKRSVMKLRIAAENCKHVLSTLNSAQCFVESIYDGMDLSINMSRARFESCINNLLQQCLEPIHEALSAASISVSEIGHVVFAGGSCKIPKLQDSVAKLFPTSTILCNSIGPDEVIAAGAACQAVLISENEFNDLDEHFVETLSADLHIKVLGMEETPVISPLCCKGSIVPSSHRQCFTLLENTKDLRLEVFEGASENLPVAALTLSNVPVGKLSFSFHVKSDGAVSISCENADSEELDIS